MQFGRACEVFNASQALLAFAVRVHEMKERLFEACLARSPGRPRGNMSGSDDIKGLYRTPGVSIRRTLLFPGLCNCEMRRHCAAPDDEG